MKAALVLFLSLSSVADAQQGDSARRTETYDVTEIMAEWMDFPSPMENLPERKVKVLDHFVPLVRGLLSPRSTLEVKDGRLTVTGTKEEHRLVLDLLQVLRKRVGLLISLQVRFLESTSPLREGQNQERARTLSKKEVQDLLEKAGEKKSATILRAPNLTLFNGQRGHIAVTNREPYTRGYDLLPDAEGRLRPVPVIGVAQTGTVFSLCPVVTDRERKEVLLDEIDLTLAEPLQTEFKEVETPYGKIQIPEIATLHLRLSHVLKEEEALLLSPLAKPENKKEGRRRLYVLVTWKLALE